VTDEVFNSASHLFAAMLSLLGTVLLITQSGGDAWKIVSFSIYGSSLMFLFACSTLHHGICSTEEVSPFFTRPAPPPPHLHFVFRRVGGVVVVVVEVFVTISRVLFLCVPIS
jgi:channel protein (hemolysin III family)